MATKTVHDIFVGDIGTHFQSEIINLENAAPEQPLDVSAATLMKMVFMTPAGTEKEFTATFVTDGIDGLVEYVTAAKADLDLEGKWAYYPYVEYPDGQRRGSEIKFTVYPGRQSEQT